MLTTILSSVLGNLLWIAGPAWLWWVWPFAGKLLLAIVLLCRGFVRGVVVEGRTLRLIW